MLVLARKVNESIVIETSDGVIEVLFSSRKSGGAIRLGIQAPKHCAVHRKEVYETIQREKRNP